MGPHGILAQRRRGAEIGDERVLVEIVGSVSAIGAKVEGRNAVADVVVIIFKFILCALADACAPFGFGYAESTLRSRASSVHFVSARENNLSANVVAAGTMRERRERAGGRVHTFVLFRICPHCSHRRILYHFIRRNPTEDMQ